MRTSIPQQVIAILFLCLCSLGSFAQPQSLRDSLFQKSSNQKTAAWILLGGGGALIMVGAILESRKAENELLSIFDADLKSNSAAGEILLISGLASMAGGIPLFIASHKNSTKAIYLNAAIRNITIPVKGSQILYSQTAITFTMPLRSK